MSFVRRHVKLAPVLVLALLAVATSVQIGCTGADDESTAEDPVAGDKNGCGYGYGGYSYGYGCYGYGYGYGYGR